MVSSIFRARDSSHSCMRRGSRTSGYFAAIVCSIALSAASAVAGVTYYVDQNHPLTSDSNPGTDDRPFTTIQRAANAVLAGDTVIVRPGVYPERVSLRNHSGTPESKITFRAEPRRQATVHGFFFGWTGWGAASHIRIQEFAVTVNGIFVPGAESVGNEAVDNYIFDVPASGVSGRVSYVARNEIVRAQIGIDVGGDGYVVEDNTVTQLKNWGAGDVDYVRFFGSNGVIRHNRLYGTDLSTTNIGGAHVDCLQSFTIYEAVRGILIEGNVCADAHQGVFVERQNYPSSDIIVRNNVFMRLGAWGVAAGAAGGATEGVLNLRVYNNVFAHHGLHGVGCGTYSTCEARNNIFHNVTNPYLSNGANAFLVSHNLLYSTSGSYGSGWDAPGNILNQNPTFLNAGDPANMGSLGDFHLQTGSPAIDAGTALQGFKADLEGTERPQGSAWDAGAYEYRVGLASPTGLVVRPVQ